jgi:hypothetical protein
VAFGVCRERRIPRLIGRGSGDIFGADGKICGALLVVFRRHDPIEIAGFTFDP